MAQITGMRIGELSARTGVSVRLLRYYEQQELLAPQRTAAGQRLFGEADVATVGRIRRLLAAGLGTRTIRTILDCACGGTGDVEPCLDPLLAAEIARLDEELSQLTRHRAALSGLRSATSPGLPAPV